MYHIQNIVIEFFLVWIHYILPVLAVIILIIYADSDKNV